MESRERSALALDFLFWCSMDAIPHSTKEQHPILKEDSLESQSNDLKTEGKKIETLNCHVSLRNNSEHSSMYDQLLTDGSDHT